MMASSRQSIPDATWASVCKRLRAAGMRWCPEIPGLEFLGCRSVAKSLPKLLPQWQDDRSRGNETTFPRKPTRFLMPPSHQKLHGLVTAVLKKGVGRISAIIVSGLLPLYYIIMLHYVSSHLSIAALMIYTLPKFQPGTQSLELLLPSSRVEHW